MFPGRVDALRIPPHDIGAEQAVLGALMLDKGAMAKVADWITEEDFYRRDHQIIFRAIAVLAEQSKPCDAITMAEWFEGQGLTEQVGGSAYVVELASTTPSAANIVAYAEIVVERSRLRTAIDIGTSLANAAFTPGTSSADAFAEAQHAVMQVAGAGRAGGLAPAKAALRAVFHETKERWERGPALIGLPTPWSAINDATRGLRPGALYIVAGRPSMGKSIMGVQLAAFCAVREARTAMFTVEMTAQECMQRACAALGGIPHDWLEAPTKDGEGGDQWDALGGVIAKLNAAPLLIDETPSLRAEQLMARARREHQRAPLQLIVVDHLHDMYRDPKKEARHAYGDIVQSAKTLAKELNVPVVMLAQLNRSVAGRSDKRPVMTDLRESGEIEQKADVILFLHREDYYDQDTHLKGVVEVIPAKGRNIRVGQTIHLANDFERMRMLDWDGPLPERSAPNHGKNGKGKAGGFD